MEGIREGKDMKVQKGQRKGNAVALVAIRQTRWTFYMPVLRRLFAFECRVTFPFRSLRAEISVLRPGCGCFLYIIINFEDGGKKEKTKKETDGFLLDTRLTFPLKCRHENREFFLFFFFP
jgi:hypothetical protein